MEILEWGERERERPKGGAMRLHGAGMTEFQRLLHSHKDKHFLEKGTAEPEGGCALDSYWQEAPESLQVRKRGKLFVCVSRLQCVTLLLDILLSRLLSLVSVVVAVLMRVMHLFFVFFTL